MKFSFTVQDLAEVVQPAQQSGATEQVCTTIAPLDEAGPGSLTFASKRSHYPKVEASAATAIIVPADCPLEPDANQVFLYCAEPSLAMTRFCAHLEALSRPRPAAGIHPTAIVAESAQIDPTAHVGPGCILEDGVVLGAGVSLQARVFLGRDVRIGDGSRLMAGVSVMEGCTLGKQVICHSGVVIGSDGFGYEATPAGPAKIPQIGTVVIGDQVEIGANTTIDRARFAATEIGPLTKIDNLVQIGHNVRIGMACILCAQVGIAGSTIIEDGVIIGGQAGLVGHIRVGKGARIGAQTGIREDVVPGQTMMGSPAHPQLLAHKLYVLQKQLPSLFQRVARLEQEPAETTA